MTTLVALRPLAGPLLMLVGTTAIAAAAAPSRSGLPLAAAQPVRTSHWHGLPLTFEVNQGQSDRRVRFLTRGAGYTAFLTRDGMTLSPMTAPGRPNVPGLGLGGRQLLSPSSDTMHLMGSSAPTHGALTLSLVGRNSNPQISGFNRLPGVVNYLIGNDPLRWRTHIPTYSDVLYRNVYHGIDLRFHGSGGSLEYDWLLASGANPSAIRMRLNGSATIDRTGGLVLRLDGLTVVQLRPHTYTLDHGVRRSVSSRYVLRSAHEIGFAVGRHDHRWPLVIDPKLAYATYLGGSSADSATGVAADASGNTYLVGTTDSPNFPVRAPYQPGIEGKGCQNELNNSVPCTDAFVTKLAPGGDRVLYSTYLGGSADDSGAAIALTPNHDPIIVGSTLSTNFPMAGALQAHFGGGAYDGDAFVTKLSAKGDKLVFSTYLGGKSEDAATSLALDRQGDLYLAGGTRSGNFPVRDARQSHRSPGTCTYSETLTLPCEDGFVTKLAANGHKLLYSTYFGAAGSSKYVGGDDSVRALAVDARGAAYVTGATTTDDFPTTPTAFRHVADGENNIFVAKFKPDGGLGYSTYLSGGSTFPIGRTPLSFVTDAGLGITVDRSGRAFVTGATTSDHFPTTHGAVQRQNQGPDAFVAELSEDGSHVLFGSYLGGAGTDVGNAIALDSAGNIYVAGATNSDDFPTQVPIQSHLSLSHDMSLGGSDVWPADAFLVELPPGGGHLKFSTYLGGSDADEAYGMALSSTGVVYIAGSTASHNLPVLRPYQRAYGGGLLTGWIAGVQGLVAPAPRHRRVG